MYRYRYRLEDRYGASSIQPIYSLGILDAETLDEVFGD